MDRHAFAVRHFDCLGFGGATLSTMIFRQVVTYNGQIASSIDNSQHRLSLVANYYANAFVVVC